MTGIRERLRLLQPGCRSQESERGRPNSAVSWRLRRVDSLDLPVTPPPREQEQEGGEGGKKRMSVGGAGAESGLP